MAKFLATLLASAVFTLFAGNACAVPTYEVNLVDPSGDPTRMMITYRLDDSFDAGFGLTLFYDSAAFSDLMIVADPIGWITSVLPPLPSVPLDGIISLMATSDIPGPTMFDVEFTYLGAGLPGSQPFELFDSSTTVVPGSGGLTRPSGTQIPEPSTSFLLSLGLLMFVRAGRRHIAPISMTS